MYIHLYIHTYIYTYIHTHAHIYFVCNVLSIAKRVVVISIRKETSGIVPIIRTVDLELYDLFKLQITNMLSLAKDTSSDDSSGAESPRKPTIFTVTIDNAGHLPSTSVDLNKTVLTSITATDSTRSVDFSVAAEKCATMVLNSIFESISLKPDNICSQSIAVPRSDLVTKCKELLKSAELDVHLLSYTSKHYTHSLSKSDLLELKRSMVKSDFKPVQDPLSASKLRKNCSIDCHPWHSPIFEISSLDSSQYVCESVIDCEEIDGSRPFILFPSVRYAIFTTGAFVIYNYENWRYTAKIENLQYFMTK